MKLIVFKPTGEVRRAEPGEWYEDKYAGLFECRFVCSTTYSHSIYTRHEIETTPEVLEAMVHINFLGSAYMTYYALPHITGQKGSIIFTSSLVALHGVPKVAGYAAGKGALTAYTESLRAEVSSKGVHIGIIYVGFTENDPKKVIYSADGSLIPLSKRKNAHTQQDVARYMLKMIKRRKKRMVLTPLGHFSSFLYRFFPNLSDWIIARFNPTNAQYSEAN